MGADIKESRDLRARATGLKLASDASQRHITETLAEVRFKVFVTLCLPPSPSLSLSLACSLFLTLSLSLPLHLSLLPSPPLYLPQPISSLSHSLCLLQTVSSRLHCIHRLSYWVISSSALLEPTLLLRIV